MDDPNEDEKYAILGGEELKICKYSLGDVTGDRPIKVMESREGKLQTGLSFQFFSPEN